MTATEIKIGATTTPDSTIAGQELCEQLRQDTLGLMVFFCSSRHDRTALAKVLHEQLPGQPVIGCTTAGEIGPTGYLEGGISGFSIPAAIGRAHSLRIDDLSHFTIRRGRDAAEQLLQAFDPDQIDRQQNHCCAFSLIDGLSVREEPVIRAFHSMLGDIPLFGGSAGDGLEFEQTHIYHEGAFHTGCGLFTLLHLECPFKVFKVQHFVRSNERMVVTGAIPEKRVVTEINGMPAAEEYARMVGITYDSLNPQVFAAHPVVVKIGDEDFVRAIQKANPDGSLTFYCAIDLGIVLTVAEGVDTIDTLRQELQSLSELIGTPELIVGCDCILRRLEFANDGSIEAVSRILADHRVIGFNTYGEQFNSMHVNQTLTGLAIGPSTPGKAA